MTIAITETRQVGGSLMVAIPKSVRKAMGLEKNQIVQIEIRKMKPGFFGNFKGIGRMHKADKLDGRL
jgi:bifunctional DNA-binding transcriptional regulator/antitoxin component of YhaV-PrlF toxin-antitoxin module